ncbi:MAG: amino acid adenylation domain-containing protein, partial [Candidatus Methanomethylophilaceae archaeon]|nr:amino acid adenylation domain-containing protein [Candidatus Methanomethylophilaceae archaeon]
SKGIGKDSFVAVLLPRSGLMAAVALGVVKSGAAYQPLDPTYPEERIGFMLSDSDVRLLIADRSLSGLVGGYRGDVLYTDEFPTLFAGEAPDVRGLAPKPEDVFVILYTSGTTGKPKGCVIENGNIAAYVDWLGGRLELGPGCRYASYASFGFDACMMDIFVTLSHGATIYVIPDGYRKDLGMLEEFYVSNGITHGFMTTQMGRMFMETTGCRSLRKFMTGGEALAPVKPPEWVDFINAYGPTETTVSVTSHRVTGESPRIPIGVPNPDVGVYVMDESLRIVPTCACGELCVSGPQVFRGYLNNPEKTASVLVPNPYAQSDSHRTLYRTGDIVRLLPDGNLDYVGRRDGLVKVRGFRIELTEVENAIRGFPGITNVTVQAFDARSGGKFLAAYVVCDGELDVKALKAHILESKPPYMVPAVVTKVDAIPLTVNGKVDRRALPVPSMDVGKVTPPSTPLQKRIFKIASDVIGDDSFGVETDLFEAGLTSIGIVKLNVLLSDEFGIPFQSKDVRENPTVRDLESFVSTAAPQETYPVLDDYPLTKSQEGIFVDCMSMPDSTRYNIPLLLAYGPGIDRGRLKAAIVSAVNAHPFMMTRITTDAKGDIRLDRKGTSSFTEDMVEEVTIPSLTDVRDLVEPFPLMGSRLFRIKLIHADREYLFVEMHHIISDGTSMGIFLDDVSRAYSGETLQPERFSGFEESLKEMSDREEALAEAKGYFEGLLAGYDLDFLPKGDRYRPGPDPVGKFRMESRDDTAASADVFCRRGGITVNSLMCAVFGFDLARYNGSDHSVFTTVYNGRNDSRTARSVSMFVKTIPVVCDLSDQERSPLSLSEAVGRQMVGTMANDTYSFAEISRELGVRPDVLFVYQGEGFGFDSFCGQPAEPVPVTLSDVKEPILFQVAREGGRFVYEVEYDGDRYTPEFIRFFTASFDAVLREFLVQPALKDVSMTDEATMELVAKVNDTDSPFDRSRTVVDLFRERARESPGSVAVVCGSQSITYGELDSVTDDIAAYVRGKGIGRDEFVAVLVPRSVDMVVAAEGVVKAGAAYQPLDPTYPEERL